MRPVNGTIWMFSMFTGQLEYLLSVPFNELKVISHGCTYLSKLAFLRNVDSDFGGQFHTDSNVD